MARKIRIACSACLLIPVLIVTIGSTAVNSCQLVTDTGFVNRFFPLPQVDDEMDELVLMDDEMMDLPPEDLPRRVLSEFAVYNSEGFCSSLELLPMWSGVDPDVDLYASGNVLDDDGEWAGGQALNTGMSLTLAMHVSLVVHSLHMPYTINKQIAHSH